MVRKNTPSQATAARKAAIERSKRWQSEHPERTRELRHEYYVRKGAAKQKDLRKANPERTKADRRRWSLKRKYGLTPEQVEGLIEEQRGRCAICRRPLGSRPIVDHDHQTNLPRGILCWNCNIALGHFEDDILRLEAAIAYLEVYHEIHSGEEIYG